MPAHVMKCAQCGAKNRIPADKRDASAKCGRCHAPLSAEGPQAGRITLRCGQCRTKNRVPLAKLHAGAKCGRCSAPIQHRDLLSGRTVMVGDGTFTQTVLQSPLPVLLYAWAPSCSVCSGTGPVVDQLAMETKGKIRVGKVNIETNPALANQYHILSVPSFLIFDAGRLKAHLPGAVPKHELMIKMAPFLYADGPSE